MNKKDIPFTHRWASPCGDHLKREEALRARVAELESGIKTALVEIKGGCYADAHSTLSSL